MFTACSDDEEVFVDNSSASLTIDGVNYTKAENFAVGFSQVTFNDEETFQINGTTANGTDSVSFSIDLPSFNVATYTKSANGDEVNLSITFEETFVIYSTNPFTFGNVDESVIDYQVEITSSNAENVSGTFSGTLMNSEGETVAVTGQFVAIDPFAALGSLFN